MSTPRRTRRRYDAAVAAALAVIVLAVGFLIWRGSDFRATASVTAPSTDPTAAPAPPTVVATSLVESWRLATDPAYGAVASPYGTVVTADRHTVTGHDARTGAALWSYGRSNVPLCAVGSGDTDSTDLSSWGGVRGIMTVYEKNGWCSQVTLLDPKTGERLYQRTSPNLPGGELAFGGPYAAWLGSDLLELWRHDLYRTIQYGDEPNPTKSGGPHLGCTFSDIALADQQFATVEHCRDKPGVAQVVINWATPSDAPKAKDAENGWDVFFHPPRATVDTNSPAARIVGITRDRVAVLVSAPKPAVVVYDATGAEISRTPVDIPATAIAAADGAGITPSVTFGTSRFSLIGNHLLAVATRTVQTAAPLTTSAAAPTTQASATPTSAATTPTSPATVSVDDPHLGWVTAGARGLPARIDQDVLVPVDGGLRVLTAAGGLPTTAGPIGVDRGGYRGRVDASAVGDMIIEIRGGTVVGLS